MNALREHTLFKLQHYCFQKRKEDKLRLILQVKKLVPLLILSNIIYIYIKRFLNKSLADVGMSQYMNALVDKVHKQTPHCYLCRDGCWIMLLCYRVHITVCMALLGCVLCQPVHSCIETSLHQLDFFLEIFSWKLVSIQNQFLSICYAVLPTHLQLMHHPRTCALTNSIHQPVHSAPSVFPTRKRRQ